MTIRSASCCSWSCCAGGWAETRLLLLAAGSGEHMSVDDVGPAGCSAEMAEAEKATEKAVAWAGGLGQSPELGTRVVSGTA